MGLLVLGFTAWIFSVVEGQQKIIIHQNDELVRLSDHLQGLNAAALAVASETGFSTALQEVVDVSRSLFKTRYAAIMAVRTAA